MSEFKNTFIAAALICIMLVLIFLFGQLYLSQARIILTNKPVVMVTRLADDWNSKLLEHEEKDIEQEEFLPGVYSIGMIVEIVNTGGDGLRIRSEAGFDGVPLYLGYEKEEFQLIDGPALIDNDIWWEIESSNGNGKKGWTIQEFLQPK